MVTLQFLVTLARDHQKRRWIHAVILANTVWALIALFGVAFQCKVPHLWQIAEGSCFNQPAFWAFAGAFDILIDLAITILPVLVLYSLQTSRGRKANAVIAFSGRLFIIPVTVLRLTYIFSSSNSSDATFDAFGTALTTEIATAFSIIFACISFTKPFLDSIETGQLACRVRQASTRTPNLVKGQHTRLTYAKTVFMERIGGIGSTSESMEREPSLVAEAQIPSGVFDVTSGERIWAGPEP